MAERDANERRDEPVTGTGGPGMNDGPSAPREIGDAEGLSAGGGGALARADGSDIGNASDIGALGGMGGAGGSLSDAPGGSDIGGAGSGTREGGTRGGM